MVISDLQICEAPWDVNKYTYDFNLRKKKCFKMKYMSKKFLPTKSWGSDSFPGPHSSTVGGDGTIIPSQDCVLPAPLAELIFGLLVYPHSEVTKMPFWHHYGSNSEPKLQMKQNLVNSQEQGPALLFLKIHYQKFLQGNTTFDILKMSPGLKTAK